MSVRLMSLAMEAPDLSSSRKFVLVVMADHSNDVGESIYPSQGTIARKTSLSRKTVVASMQELVEMGYILKLRRRSTRQYEYRINVDKLLNSVDKKTQSNLGLLPTVTSGNSPKSPRVTSRSNLGLHEPSDEPSVEPSDESKRLINSLVSQHPELETYFSIWDRETNVPIKDTKKAADLFTEFIQQGITVGMFREAIRGQKADGRYKVLTPFSVKKWAMNGKKGKAPLDGAAYRASWKEWLGV